jgi:TonB family protein
MPHGGAMFEESSLGRSWRMRRPLPLSIALHLVIFLLVLSGRTPLFVAPTSTLAGAHGNSITHIYWAAGTSDTVESNASPSNNRKDRFKSRLQRNKSDRARLTSPVEPSPQEPDKPQESASAVAPAPTAGSPYGTLTDGSQSGEDVRPALPAVTSEPHVSSDDLRGVSEGNVIVEIIIDERGAIVRKSVTQSMGPAIDAKVLAALENWRFHPATRDGVPIPSKQDVVYHFKPRAS